MSERMWSRGDRSQEPVDADAEQLAWDERVREIVRPPWMLDAKALLAKATLQTLFLADAAVPAGAITIFCGPPGAKKSWLAYSLAIAVAQGGEWLGSRVTPRGPTNNTLVLNYDNPTPELGRRFMRLGMQPDDPIHFHSVELDPFRLPQYADEVRALVSHYRPSLVIVDSLRQAQTEDENDSKVMADIMRTYKSLYAHGAAVVIIHHAGKGALTEGVNKVRGSSEIAGSADAVVDVIQATADTPDMAIWTKHRSWQLEVYEEARAFELKDHGESTILTLKEQ
jgi:RecA-family ATPase